MKRMLFAATLLVAPSVVSIADHVLPGAGLAHPAQSSLSPQAHWETHSVIQVWIDRQNPPVRGDQLVERAMHTWSTASDGAFTLRRTFLERDAGIRVYF